MSTTGLPPFDTTMQKSNEWLGILPEPLQKSWLDTRVS